MTSPSLERPPAPQPLGHPTIDSHCHLDLRLDDEPELSPAAALAAAREVGVTHIVQVGCDVPGAQWAADFREAAIGARRVLSPALGLRASLSASAVLLSH